MHAAPTAEQSLTGRHHQSVSQSRQDADDGPSQGVSTISLACLVHAAVRRMIGEHSDRRFDIELAEADLPPTVEPTALDNALVSVLSNACRFSLPSSRVRVISRIAWADGSPHLVLAVCDRGIGMRRAHQQRAFEPGWQAHAGQNAAGRGMGLTQARQLVDAQGGWMELRSALGIGTEVEIWLPTLNAGRPV